MRAWTRALTDADLDAVTAFCERDPVVHLPLMARILRYPPGTRGTMLLGHFTDDGLASVCFVGSNMIVSEADDAALDDFAERCRTRRVGSLVGPASAVLGLHERLARGHGTWAHARNTRDSQPLMAWTGRSTGPAEPTLRMLTEDEFGSYLDASVRMYTDEIGVTPMVPGSGYEDIVRQRLHDGLAYGVVRAGRVLFKADLGIVLGRYAQIQGVWLDPALRGRGLAVPAMSGTLQAIRGRYPHVSLYVNDFNTPAIRTYERCGFVRVGTFATVHY